MSNENKKQDTSSEELRTSAVKEVLKKHPHITSIRGDLNDFVHKVGLEFIKNKLHNFSKLCTETRRVNYLKQKELEGMGNPKGWSAKKDFKFDYIIPKDFYMFMINMVYRNFWNEDNEKVWRSLMKAIMRGDDSAELLKKVKIYYGSVSKHD